MMSVVHDSVEVEEWEEHCAQCRLRRPLSAFTRQRGTSVGRRKICSECEQANREARHARVTLYRELRDQSQERAVRRQQAREESLALRQRYEQHQFERMFWYQQQPDRVCRSCRELLPASAFGGVSSPDGFVLHTRCKDCHELFRTHHQPICCLCQQKLPRRDFLTHYDGYALSTDGAWVSLCCKRCEDAFRTLPVEQQADYIRACCQRSFPAGQVIYAEVDPETDDIRYVGRTAKPPRRHAQHLSDISPTAALWGAERKAWFTRGNWMYTLAKKGLMPSMHILHQVEVAPLVIEWELRAIWHGMQQGWRLLNVETMNEELVERVRASRLNFLQAPFDLLVQQCFFSSHGLTAFLRKWHQPEVLLE